MRAEFPVAAKKLSRLAIENVRPIAHLTENNHFSPFRGESPASCETPAATATPGRRPPNVAINVLI
jgi:hypothetical protein